MCVLSYSRSVVASVRRICIHTRRAGNREQEVGVLYPRPISTSTSRDYIGALTLIARHVGVERGGATDLSFCYTRINKWGPRGGVH